MKQMNNNWDETVSCVEAAVWAIDKGDYSQPIKPYLRYRNRKNRIIAMPAYVGQDINATGIKWIASFPENITKGIPRANSVVVLNDVDTGVVKSIFNTSLISIIRTASVSGLMIKYYLKERKRKKINIGIIGLGPIGQYHCRMCCNLYGEIIDKIFVYDKRNVSLNINNFGNKIEVLTNWNEVYEESDIFITCTVSDERYINEKPKEGNLLLNVSLRDYTNDIYEFVKDTIIVDDWDEVCREDTDIEQLYLYKGLQKSMVKSIADVVCRGSIGIYKEKDSIMFNPMGMGVFDIAISQYYYEKAIKLGIGTELE